MVSIKDKITIRKGLTISTGWNLGKKSRSNHLFDPLISVPRTGTSNKLKKAIENKIIENLVSIFWFKNENQIKIIIASVM